MSGSMSKIDYKTSMWHPCYNKDCDECRKKFVDTFNDKEYFCLYSMVEEMAKSMKEDEIYESVKGKFWILQMNNATTREFIKRAAGWHKRTEDECKHAHTAERN